MIHYEIKQHAVELGTSTDVSLLNERMARAYREMTDAMNRDLYGGYTAKPKPRWPLRSAWLKWSWRVRDAWAVLCGNADIC